MLMMALIIITPKNFGNASSISVKPNNLTCIAPVLDHDKETVSITCTATKVFPSANCIFYVDDKIPDYNDNVSVSNVKWTQASEYYTTHCTWISSLSNFHQGIHQFSILMYPVILNETIDTFYGIKAASPALNLTMPSAELSKDCTNNNVAGFFRPNAIVICICYLSNIGNPPGNVQWFNNQGEVTGEMNVTAAKLTITSSMENRQFTCKIKTSLKGTTHDILFNVTYAIGPTSCSVTPEGTTRYALCNNKNITLNVTCQAEIYDVKPGIKSIFYINGSKASYQKSNDFDLYMTNTELEVRNSGSAVICCEAQNLIFNDINITCNFTVQVAAPPRLPPMLFIDINDDNLYINVTENKVSILKCSVPDGIPQVSNITVTCGNLYNETHNGNMLTSTVSFTRNMSGDFCTCTAEHVSGCYNNNKTLKQLNVRFQSTVIDFSVTNLVENGTYAEFICEADGNPAPNIFISKENKNIAQNSSGYFLFLNKSMSCKDAGNYFCQANNGIDSNIQETKQVTVYVKCPLQFVTVENFKNFSLQLGKPFSYSFSVYGYPVPDKFKIFNSNKESRTIIVTNSSLETPFITVNLKILSLSFTDFGNYTLQIFQNGKWSLTLNFTINEVIQVKEEDIFFAAAIGGSVAAGCLVVIFAIIITYLYRRRSFFEAEKLDVQKYLKYFTFDTSNGEMYSIQAKLKVTSIKVKDVTYKNYKDIVQTITTATAVPKNMYKPEVKPKPKITKNTGYYNFIEPIISLDHDLSIKKELLDENVYANQGFDEK